MNLKKVGTTLSKLGMNIAEAVTILLKQVVMTDSIPFVIKKPKYSEEMIEAIKEANDIVKNPKIKLVVYKIMNFIRHQFYFGIFF